MNNNGLFQKHWFAVAAHFAADAVLFCIAFVVATELRLGSDTTAHKLFDYYPAIMMGAFAFSCAAYVAGLYSPLSTTRQPLKRLLTLTVCCLIAFGVMLVMDNVTFSARIGRGVLLIGTPLAFAIIFAHHTLLLRHWQHVRERVEEL